MNILEELVYPVVDEMQGSVIAGARLIKAPETLLLGSDAPLDSIGFVTFVVAVEERIAEATGRAITLADEKALSLSASPFRTLGALADYIAQRLLDAR